jgi:tetratricopeptide (TPR) repeat protein
MFVKRKLPQILLILFIAFINAYASAEHATFDSFIWADKMFADGKYAEALQAYKRILASRTDNAEIGRVYSRIGDCLFQLQDYSGALNSYRNALQQQKRSQRPSTQYWIGFCTFLLGRDRDAVAEFLKIPELYPSSGMWVGTAYYWAGRASERMGEKDLAGEYYRKAGGKGVSTQEQFALRNADRAKGK